MPGLTTTNVLPELHGASYVQCQRRASRADSKKSLQGHDSTQTTSSKSRIPAVPEPRLSAPVAGIGGFLFKGPGPKLQRSTVTFHRRPPLWGIFVPVRVDLSLPHAGS
ncbi:hypothetical protein FDECE_12692 [Fusarium decemcellulare]|nr:hypothetical protein FDECE_12692 [Fusarium decemcellulare]